MNFLFINHNLFNLLYIFMKFMKLSKENLKQKLDSKKLKELREKLKISQSEIAEILGGKND